MSRKLFRRISRDAALFWQEEVQEWVCGGRIRLVINSNGKLKREIKRLVMAVIIEGFKGRQISKPV